MKTYHKASRSIRVNRITIENITHASCSSEIAMGAHCTILTLMILSPFIITACAITILFAIQINFIINVTLHKVRDRCVVCTYAMKIKKKEKSKKTKGRMNSVSEKSDAF